MVCLRTVTFAFILASFGYPGVVFSAKYELDLLVVACRRNMDLKNVRRY